MRIAYVITRADAVGGASIHVRDLAGAMLERGHQVMVIVGGRGPVTGQLAAAGVPFRSMEFLRRAINPARDLRALGEIAAALRDWRPDLVSTHTAKAGWLGRAACRWLGLPVIYTPHGWSIGSRISARTGPLFALAEKLASRWASAIICVCEYEKRLALAQKVATAEKLRVVHNGVRDVAAALLAKPGLNPVRICSVARFASPKDHATLLASLAALRSQPWELHLVGEGPLELELRRMAAQSGIAERVRFLGYQPHPEGALSSAQLFVLSSRSEGFPRSVLEAMRAGLPVIASEVGGVGEAITGGVDGLLVPPGGRDALSSAIAALIADAPRRERMGAAARFAYESRFRLQTMVENTVRIYASVLNKGVV